MNQKIENVLLEHNVSRLCHMTQIDKLFSILYGDTGIWANDFYEGTSMYRNDLERRDGCTKYISTSIEYPNVWYYNAKRDTNPKVNTWAVIFIDTHVCKDESTLFCPINSASSKGRYIGKQVEIFNRSFDSVVGFRHRTPLMLECCPTDDQAEVLIYRYIPVSAICGVAFESERIANLMWELFDKYGVRYPDLYSSKDLFTTNMSHMIRHGYKPCEDLIVKGNRELDLKGCA